MWTETSWIPYEPEDLIRSEAEIIYVICWIIHSFINGKERTSMLNKLFLSYTLAAMAGICFVSGIAVLSGGR